MKVKVVTPEGVTFVGFNGRSVPLHTGDEYDESDPLVKAFPQYFTQAPVPERPSKLRR